MAKPNPYGVKAVRHLKSSSSAVSRKRLDRSGRVCTTKQAAMDRTYDYFLREVDPIIGECITYLLCIRPDDVAATMLDFLEKRQKGETPSIGKEQKEKATKAQRLYLATQISPVITKLVNRIALTRPSAVLSFMCEELASIISEAGASNSVNSGGEPCSKPDPVPPTVKAKSMNLIFLGLAGAGKSSFIDALQGKFNESIRPTIGFRPTSMMMGVDKVRLNEVGGGPKIRKIWPEYFHDTHAIVYMIDSSETDPDAIGESIEVFKETIENPLLHNKPLIFVSNKQDHADSKSADIIKELYSVDAVSNCSFAEVSCRPGGPESSHAGGPDPRLESALEELLTRVQQQYSVLDARVEKDSAHKAELDLKKRQEKERRILRNKIICAFPHLVDKAFIDADTPKEPEDTFTVEDGETFLAAEIGLDKLPPIGVEVAAMIGYQKLALQMVGAFISPISKKKKAMSWEECRALVMELRLELGIVDIR